MAISILGKYIKSKLFVHEGLVKNFYGLGLKDAQKICAAVGLYPKMRIGELSDQQILAVSKQLTEKTIEGEARSIIRENIQFKRKIGTYQGMRHLMGLPVNGQNTRNNAKTAKKLNRLQRRG